MQRIVIPKSAESRKTFYRKMSFGSFITLFVFLFLWACGNNSSTQKQSTEKSGPVVVITGGKVQGLELAGGAVTFKGLPYAAPPVGDLRWKEPEPVIPWDTIRDASKFCAPCAQIDAGWNKNSASIASENCLFVNVWTPDLKPVSKQPVMVWIHGGGNTGGSSLGLGGIEPSFEGEDLMRNGVVVVSLNYRLGILGFMAHPELTAESANHASGNYGLMDQIAALRWVQNNIEIFGGDPNNVTVFGQSAGAHDIGLLVTSPLAKGLFQRAIAESGSVIIGGALTPALKDMEAIGAELGKNMGAPEKNAIAYMRSLPVDKVLAVSPSYGGRQLRSEPDVDGYVLPVLPALVYKQGNELPVPMIIGNNARERSLPKTQAADSAIKAYFGPLAKRALIVYGVDGKSKGETFAPYGDVRAQFTTDNMFRLSSSLEAQWHSSKATTYYYQFAHGYEPRGAAHSWELQYVFGNLRADASQKADSTISEQVQTYWTNFAKTGDPNDGLLPQWPKLDASRNYLEFTDDKPVVKSNLRGDAFILYSDKVNADITKRKP